MKLKKTHFTLVMVWRSNRETQIDQILLLIFFPFLIMSYICVPPILGMRCCSTNAAVQELDRGNKILKINFQEISNSLKQSEWKKSEAFKAKAEEVWRHAAVARHHHTKWGKHLSDLQRFGIYWILHKQCDEEESVPRPAIRSRTSYHIYHTMSKTSEITNQF